MKKINKNDITLYLITITFGAGMGLLVGTLVVNFITNKKTLEEVAEDQKEKDKKTLEEIEKLISVYGVSDDYFDRVWENKITLEEIKSELENSVENEDDYEFISDEIERIKNEYNLTDIPENILHRLDFAETIVDIRYVETFLEEKGLMKRIVISDEVFNNFTDDVFEQEESVSRYEIFWENPIKHGVYKETKANWSQRKLKYDTLEETLYYVPTSGKNIEIKEPDTYLGPGNLDTLLELLISDGKRTTVYLADNNTYELYILEISTKKGQNGKK